MKVLFLLAAVFSVSSSLSLTNVAPSGLHLGNGQVGLVRDKGPTACDICLTITRKVKADTANVTTIANRELQGFCEKYAPNKARAKCQELAATALNSLGDLLSHADDICVKTRFCPKDDSPEELNKMPVFAEEVPAVQKNKTSGKEAWLNSTALCITCDVVALAVGAALLGPIDVIMAGFSSICLFVLTFMIYGFPACIAAVTSIVTIINAPLLLTLNGICQYGFQCPGLDNPDEKKEHFKYLN